MAMALERSSNEYMTYSTAFWSQNDPKTLACWFKSTDLTNQQFLVTITDHSQGASGDFWALRLAGHVANDPVQALTYSSTQGSAMSASTSTGYSSGTWHHACAVFASGSARYAYIDGGSKGSELTTYGTPLTTSHIGVGELYRSDSPNGTLDGDIAEVAIWDAALTDAEVASLAKGFRPSLVRPSALIFYAPLVREGSPARELWDTRSLAHVGTLSVSTHPPTRGGR